MRLSRLSSLAILLALLTSSVALATPTADRSDVSFALLGRHDTGLGEESAEDIANGDGRMYLISRARIRSTEGVTFVPASGSPLKHALVLVGNEISGTVSIYLSDQ